MEREEHWNRFLDSVRASPRCPASSGSSRAGGAFSATVSVRSGWPQRLLSLDIGDVGLHILGDAVLAVVPADARLIPTRMISLQRRQN